MDGVGMEGVGMGGESLSLIKNIPRAGAETGSAVAINSA